MTGCSWNKSPIATMLTPPNGSELPLISLSLFYICTVNIVLPTIDISSMNISFSLPI